MLRALVLALTGGLFALSLLALAFAGPAALAWVVGSGLLLAGTVFERVRYKRLAAAAPAAGFRRTPERFFATETGVPVTVWVDPLTGERKYVRD